MEDADDDALEPRLQPKPIASRFIDVKRMHNVAIACLDPSPPAELMRRMMDRLQSVLIPAAVRLGGVVRLYNATETKSVPPVINPKFHFTVKYTVVPGEPNVMFVDPGAQSLTVKILSEAKDPSDISWIASDVFGNIAQFVLEGLTSTIRTTVYIYDPKTLAFDVPLTDVYHKAKEAEELAQESKELLDAALADKPVKFDSRSKSLFNRDGTEKGQTEFDVPTTPICRALAAKLEKLSTVERVTITSDPFDIYDAKVPAMRVIWFFNKDKSFDPKHTEQPECSFTNVALLRDYSNKAEREAAIAPPHFEIVTVSQFTNQISDITIEQFVAKMAAEEAREFVKFRTDLGNAIRQAVWMQDLARFPVDDMDIDAGGMDENADED